MIVWFQVGTIMIITTEDYFSPLACVIASPIYCTLHFYFFMNHLNVAATLITCAVMQTHDRTKVYFAVGGTVVQWFALLPYSKSLLSIPPGAGVQNFHVLLTATWVSLLYYGFLPPSVFMKVGDSWTCCSDFNKIPQRSSSPERCWRPSSAEM